MTVGALLTEVLHPFGRAGAVNTTGAIYGTTVSTGIVADIFANIETVNVPLPVNAMITEVEFGLTAGYAVTTTTAGFSLRWKITDKGGTSYDALVASTAALVGYTGTSLTDITYMGRKTPSSGTYFTGKGSFDILSDVACGSTSKAQGAVKQSTYIQYTYSLLG